MNTTTIDNNIYSSGVNNFYSIDGENNNVSNTNFGSVGSQLLNIAALDYGDRISSPAGSDRTNPRVISNTLAQQDGLINSSLGLTNFIWAFGQFVDHDIILTPEDHELRVAIEVPTGDPFLDPDGTGTVTISMGGTAFTEGTGTDINNPAEIDNNITAWVDGSNIYGSDAERNDYLREGSSGLLKVSVGNFLPLGNESFQNANPSRQDPFSLFAAGDVRANENSVLASMHTLFVREHNRLAAELAVAHPSWTDDQLYERARQINIAQYQSVVYNEYLPSLLGNNAVSEYTGYNSSVNPTIDRSFSSAGFRVGHTQISSQILRLDTEGNEVPQGHLTLKDVFFRSTGVIQESGIDPIVRGIASSLSQEIDLKLIDDLRNLLFTFGPHTSGRDLLAINIQRGRLNGVNDYNSVREAYGLPRVNGFADITSNVEVQTQLASLYGNVDNIDLYVGLLAEDHVNGAAVGETFQTIIARQFVALRDGDRFYYENIFTPEEIVEIESTTLSDIIVRNTDTTVIQDNAFSLLNEGTRGNDELYGGLGNDSIYGGEGNDTLAGFSGDDFISGGAGDDLLLGYEGQNILDGNVGDDVYWLNLSSAGSQIYDAAGFDRLSLVADDINLNSLNIEDRSSFSLAEITLDRPAVGTVGLNKVDNDLIVDLNRDGVANPADDLRINDFFGDLGQAGTGFVEGINNLFGSQIVDYFAGNSVEAPTVHRFFRTDTGSHFYTASLAEKQAIDDNLPQYSYEGVCYQAASSSEAADPVSGAKPVYRFFNKSTGAHLYTISEVEKDYVEDNLSNYSSEGVAYYAFDTPQEDTVELYRLYQTQEDFHFFTPSVAERDLVIDNLPHYQLEGNGGVAFYVRSVNV